MSRLNPAQSFENRRLTLRACHHLPFSLGFLEKLDCLLKIKATEIFLPESLNLYSDDIFSENAEVEHKGNYSKCRLLSKATPTPLDPGLFASSFI